MKKVHYAQGRKNVEQESSSDHTVHILVAHFPVRRDPDTYLVDKEGAKDPPEQRSPSG